MVISWQKLGGGQVTLQVQQLAVTMALTVAAQGSILT